MTNVDKMEQWLWQVLYYFLKTLFFSFFFLKLNFPFYFQTKPKLIGHDHTYARSYTMNSFANSQIANTNNNVTLNNGQSFILLSGVGGRSVDSGREPARAWWATAIACNT